MVSNANGNTFRLNHVNLNSNYLDGVSVSSNNKHVWSVAACCLCDEIDENINYYKPRFVGNNYTCSELDYLWRNQQQCGTDSSWVFKVLPPKTADIIVRVSNDQASGDEDIALTDIQ